MTQYHRVVRDLDVQVGDIVADPQDGYVRVVAIHQIEDPTGNGCTIMWESSTGRFFPKASTTHVDVLYREA